jgi:hypothetical protein
LAVGEGRRVAVGVHTYGGWERAAGPPRSRTRRDARARSAAPRRLWALPLRGPATMASGALFGSCCRWDLGLAPAPSFRLRRDHAALARARAAPSLRCRARGAASLRASSGRAAVDRFRIGSVDQERPSARISKKSHPTIIVLCDLVGRGRPHAPWEVGQVRRPRPASDLQCLDVCRL